MTLDDWLDEFVSDWKLSGKSPSTATTYCRYLRELDEFTDGTVTLASTKVWLASAPSAETARGRARAVRAFGRWAAKHDGPDWSWWRDVPLASTPPTPQPTVEEADYRAAVRACRRDRDRLAIELLWCTGCRVSEIARLVGDDINLAARAAVVRTSKTKTPRMVPLSAAAVKLIRRHGGVGTASLTGMSSVAIQQMLKRIGAPSAHAWRRGWAVRALRNGVSQTSVQAAAGWSSGAMVTRYTSAVSSELALAEFARTME
jgi:integrase